MKRIIVTGGSGFIGRHCLPRLIESGYDVHVLTSRHHDQTVGQWHTVDLMDQEAVSTAVREIQPTHLLHLAWVTEPGRYWTAPENLNWLSSSLHLIQSFQEAGGKRVVVSGSCAEYDWNYGLCHEDLTPLKPHTLYGQCKNSLQSVLASYARQKGLSWGWGRLFFLYGPYGSSAKIPGLIIESLLNDRRAPCSHGQQIRDFMHVADAADAMIALLDSDYQGPINIASGEPIALRDIILKVANHFGRPDLIDFGAVPTSENEPPLLVADIRHLRKGLGWTPSYSLASGLNATIEWRKGALHECRN